MSFKFNNFQKLKIYFHLKISRLAGGLKKLGVSKGDRVVIYMPLIPEVVIAMLATVRIGAIHSVVFGGKYHSLLFLKFPN